MSKVILYIATSSDGFIADKNGGVDWLPHPTEDNTDEVGYQALMQNIEIIIMGRKSYEQILGFGNWGWPTKTTYVFTRQSLETTVKNVFFINESPSAFIAKLKIEFPKKNIWLLGGAQLIKAFADEQLIDECIITIVPVAIYEGIKLELPYDDFTLISTKKCCDNLVQNTYIKK